MVIWMKAKVWENGLPSVQYVNTQELCSTFAN